MADKLVRELEKRTGYPPSPNIEPKPGKFEQRPLPPKKTRFNSA